MSRPIDEKIVAMKMDNSDFTAKAAETVGVFGKLTNALNKIPGINFGAPAKGINDISAASTSAVGSIGGLGTSVDAIAGRFTTMGVIATTALTNIVNKAVDAGTRLAKSLTLDQVNAGFQEYETKMGSIQTILANTQAQGTDLNDVNRNLDELNAYADKTIYNFAEMTKNIGLFTNAGLGLDESTSMIKGFSNAAAASGSNAESAARAAYQLSQGLSSGYIMQMDWMSLTNAGMGNDNMKRDLIAIGKAKGELDKSLSDDAIVKDWKNMLSDDKWLTSDIMSTYLQAMAGDMDKAKLSAIGLSDAQADLLLQNAKTGEEAATYVRTFSGLMDTLKESIGSGWATSFQLIFGDFNEATKLWTAANDAIGGIVSRSADSRNKLIGDFNELGGKASVIKAVSNIFKSLTQTLGIVKDAFQEVFPPLTAKQLADAAKAFATFTDKLVLGKKGAGELKTIFNGLFSVLGTVVELAKVVGRAIIDMIPKGTGSSIKNFVLNLAKMSTGFRKSVETGNGLTSFIKSLGSVIGGAIQILGNISKFIGSAVVGAFKGILKVGRELQPFFEGLGKTLASVAKGVSIEDLFAGGFIAGMLLIAKAVKDTSDNIGGFIDSMVEAVTGISEGFGGMEDIVETIGGIGDALNAMTTGVRIFSLLQIAVAVGILAVSMKLIADLPAQDIFKTLEVIGIALAGITWALLAIAKFDFAGKGTLGASVLLMSVASSLLLLSGALKILATIEPKQMVTALLGLVVTLGGLVLALGALSKMGSSIKIGAVSMIGLSVAIVLLAASLKILSSIDGAGLTKGLIALTVVFAQIAIFLKVVTGAKLNPATAISMNLIATAIIGIAASIYIIAGMDVGSLVKGLITIGLILTQITIFSKVVQGPSMVTASISMNLIAAALILMIVPIKALGSMDLASLAKGLGAVAIVLGLVVLALAGASGGLAGAVAITAVAIAIGILVPPLLALSKLSLAQVGIGLLALAGAFTVIGIAAVVLGTVAAPAMAVFAATLLVIGIAMAAIGLGISAFAAGLTALVAITVTSIAGIVGAFVLLLKGIAQAIPEIINVISAFLLGITGMFAKEAPKMAQHILSGILKIINVLTENVPAIMVAMAELMMGLSRAVQEAVPGLVQEAVALITTFITAMADTIHQNHEMLVSAVFQLMIAILEVVIDVMEQLINVLFGWIPGVEVATGAIGDAAKNALSDRFTALEVGQQKGQDFAGGVQSGTGAASSAGSAVGNSAKTGANGVDLSSIGVTKGKDFSSGLGGTSGSANSSGITIANAGKSGAGSISLSSSGQNFGLGFANGIANSTVIGRVASAGLAIARAAKNAVSGWLDEHSPSKLMEQSGIYFSQGFANGIHKLRGVVGNTAKGVAQVASETLNEFIEGFDAQPEDNEVHFKAVVDYEALDSAKFGSPKAMRVIPNLAMTNGLVASARSELRNNKIIPTVTATKEQDENRNDNAPKQPIVLQTMLNGRVLAEQIIEDVSRLQSQNQQMVDRARGVL